jgi:general secretion pathway protein H
MKSNFNDMRAKKGFSLIEILVVMLLLAMASSLIFFNVGKSMGNKQAKAFAQEMVSLCKKARRMAIDNGVPTALHISSTQRRCWVSGATKSLEVPEQMLIEGEGVNQLNEDVYAVRFYPDGSSGGGELTLSISGRTIYAFRVDALTGLLTRIEKDA